MKKKGISLIAIVQILALGLASSSIARNCPGRGSTDNSPDRRAIFKNSFIGKSSTLSGPRFNRRPGIPKRWIFPPAIPSRGNNPPAIPSRGNNPPADPPQGNNPPADPPQGNNPPADPPEDNNPPADPPEDNNTPENPPQGNPPTSPPDDFPPDESPGSLPEDSSTGDPLDDLNAPDLNYQPDALIGVSALSLQGDAVYNETGSEQSESLKSQNRKVLRFSITLENDGQEPDEFTIDATGGNRFFKANLFQITNTGARENVTGAVTSGSFTEAVDPGSAVRLTLETKRKGRKTRSFKRKSFLVTVASSEAPDRKDAVLGKIRCR